MFNYNYVVSNNLISRYDTQGHFIVRSFKRNFFSWICLFILGIGHACIGNNFFEYVSNEPELRLNKIDEKPEDISNRFLCRIFEFSFD